MLKTVKSLIIINLTIVAIVCSSANVASSAEAAGIKAVAIVTDPIGLSTKNVIDPTHVSLLFSETSSESSIFCSVRLPEQGSVYLDISNSNSKTFSAHLNRNTPGNTTLAGYRLIPIATPSQQIMSSGSDNSTNLIVTISYSEN